MMKNIGTEQTFEVESIFCWIRKIDWSLTTKLLSTLLWQGWMSKVMDQSSKTPTIISINLLHTSKVVPLPTNHCQQCSSHHPPDQTSSIVSYIGTSKYMLQNRHRIIISSILLSPLRASFLNMTNFIHIHVDYLRGICSFPYMLQSERCQGSKRLCNERQSLMQCIEYFLFLVYNHKKEGSNKIESESCR